MIVLCPTPEQLKGSGNGRYEEAEPEYFPAIGKECRNRVFKFIHSQLRITNYELPIYRQLYEKAPKVRYLTGQSARAVTMMMFFSERRRCDT